MFRDHAKQNSCDNRDTRGYVSTSGLKLILKFTQRTSLDTSAAPIFTRLKNLSSFIGIRSIGFIIIYRWCTLFHTTLGSSTPVTIAQYVQFRLTFQLPLIVVFLIVTSIKHQFTNRDCQCMQKYIHARAYRNCARLYARFWSKKSRL